MNFLIWIKDFLFGSFTSVAEHFSKLYNDAIAAGLSPDWPAISKTCALVTFWLGSAFFAATVAELKNRSRLVHFIGGLLVPWIYPFVILFRLERKSDRPVEEEEEIPNETAAPNEAPEAKLGIDGDDDEEESPHAERISQAFMKKISTDELGNSRGPFMFVFDDDKVLQVEKIVNALPEHVAVEIIEKAQPRTLRFPYAKIKSVVRKEEWDPENIPVMEKAEAPRRPDAGRTVQKDDGLGVTPTLVSRLKQLSKNEMQGGNPEETAKLTMEMMSKSTHIGSYVILKPGIEIGGCRIISEIGKGGMGMVYLARHTRLDVNVAVKVISAKCEDENDMKISQRFLQEAKIAAKVRHPHLVAVMDAGKDEANDLFYIVMEYMDGGTVGDMIRKDGKLKQDDALNIVLAVAEALSAGQKVNIVHRDIKPDNIMLTSEGDIKLSDLGLAKINEPRMELHLTGVNMVMGSIPYMSPEQAKDFASADFRSDVYSIGASFYHMLSGDFPYKADNPLALMMKAINDPIPNPKALSPDIDDEVAAACMKMMSKLPQDRFQTSEELIAELSRLSSKIST